MHAMKHIIKDYALLVRWMIAGAPAALPPPLKRRFIAKQAGLDSDWIETGTYRGLTTKFLARRFPRSRIVTIEPADALYHAAKQFLAEIPNITVLHGDSAKILGDAITRVGDHVTFFLDGHFSGGETFQNEHACPIPSELEFIRRHAGKLKKSTILIDDARLLHAHTQTGYPSPAQLSEWASQNGYSLREEHDMFILRRG